MFSHDVTAAILVSQNHETAAMLVSQTNPLGVELFSYANAFFCSNKFALMLATCVKTLYRRTRPEKLFPYLLATRVCSKRNTFKQIRYERKTLRVWFNGRFVKYIDEYLFFVSSAGTIYNVLFQLSSLKSKNLKICIF